MNRFFARATEKMNKAPNSVWFASFALMMAAASFTGLLYNHGVVLGCFWLAAALFHIIFISTR